MTKEKEEEEFANVLCVSCGIHFGLPKEMEKAWRKSGKTFYCPNEHSLHWDKEDPNDEKTKLAKEVKELTDKLATLKKELIAKDKKIEELLLEIEIWHPSDKTLCSCLPIERGEDLSKPCSICTKPKI